MSSWSIADEIRKNVRWVLLFWLGISKDIEEMVSSCDKCMTYQNNQPKGPMQSRDIPLLPWQIVASDVLEHKNQNYLKVIDYYSKYIEAVRLNDNASNDIRCLSEICSRHGYPQTLVADNVPYNSREMWQYAKQYGINVTTGSMANEYPENDDRRPKTLKNTKTKTLKRKRRPIEHVSEDPKTRCGRF